MKNFPDCPTRQEKIEILVSVAYPLSTLNAKDGRKVKNWRNPNSKLFKGNLEEQPDNVIDYLYLSMVRQRDLRLELSRVKRENKKSHGQKI